MKIYRTKEERLSVFREQNVTYLTDYQYLIPFPDGLELDQSPYYLDNIEEFETLTTRYGEEILNNVVIDSYIKESEGKGLGLFASGTIKKDSFIGIYLGVVKESEEFVHYDESGFDTDYAWDYPDEVEGLPLMEIDAKPAGNELRYINHGIEPNLSVEHTLVNNRWYIFFIANRDIEENEELLVSYGEAYWDTDYRELL